MQYFVKALLCRSWLKFDTVSKKAFNLPLLACLKLQAGWLKRFYCICIGFSSIEVDSVEIQLKVVDFKVDQKNLRLVNLTEVWAKNTHTQWM